MARSQLQCNGNGNSNSDLDGDFDSSRHQNIQDLAKVGKREQEQTRTQMGWSAQNYG